MYLNLLRGRKKSKKKNPQIQEYTTEIVEEVEEVEDLFFSLNYCNYKIKVF